MLSKPFSVTLRLSRDQLVFYDEQRGTQGKSSTMPKSVFKVTFSHARVEPRNFPTESKCSKACLCNILDRPF